MVDSQFADLIGGVEEPPDFEEPYNTASTGRDFTLTFGSVHEIDRGVTIPWLCQAFTMPRKTVLKLIEPCPVLRIQSNAKVYDLRVVAAYLVRPRVDLKTYINSLESKDLPDHLRREFWAAKLAEQRWRAQAGELWSSEDVIAVFGEVFKLIKSKTQLWANTIDSVESLSNIQRDTLTDLVDELLGAVFKSLEDLESGKATPAQIAEADDDDEAQDIGI